MHGVISRSERMEGRLLVQQRDRIQELEEQVRQLKELLAPPSVKIALDWRLTGSEAAIYRVLVGRRSGVATNTALLFAIEQENGHENVDAKTVDVHVFKLRRKLKRFGGEIETIWGEGYRLSSTPVEPTAMVPALNGPQEAMAMIDFVAEDIGPRCSRLFVTAVRHLAVAGGSAITADKLADLVYEGWSRPSFGANILRDAIRRHRHRLGRYGWELRSAAGKGGGYVLRKRLLAHA